MSFVDITPFHASIASLINCSSKCLHVGAVICWPLLYLYHFTYLSVCGTPHHQIDLLYYPLCCLRSLVSFIMAVFGVNIKFANIVMCSFTLCGQVPLYYGTNWPFSTSFTQYMIFYSLLRHGSITQSEEHSIHWENIQQ